ncbi:MAG: CemA family protein [Nostocaceae cyanobacterium]|nr:CemA family protein [Nostocaceae cyanobacterium]
MSTPEDQKGKKQDTEKNSEPSQADEMKVQPVSQKTGVLPRSIGRTINKIKTELDPKAEEDFVKKFRTSRNRTRIALRFVLLLIILPLLTHHFSKIILMPLTERVRGEDVSQTFINREMEEEALHELKLYESKLKFEMLLHKTPKLEKEEIQEKLKEKSLEISEEFRHKSNLAITNIFADFLSLVAFALVISNSKKEIAIVKSFIDEIIYGLSDSAKAFLIILFTDVFVGFHSPHGWEILLEGLAQHLGVPAYKSAIGIFIATFPVVLDTIFKYWIFRYLSRISPSALATYKEMNE